LNILSYCPDSLFRRYFLPSWCCRSGGRPPPPFEASVTRQGGKVPAYPLAIDRAPAQWEQGRGSPSAGRLVIGRNNIRRRRMESIRRSAPWNGWRACMSRPEWRTPALWAWADRQAPARSTQTLAAKIVRQAGKASTALATCAASRGREARPAGARSASACRGRHGYPRPTEPRRGRAN